MTCDDVQLLLSTEARPLSPEVESHLAGCEACRAYEADAQVVLGLAGLPELSAAERAKLATLPVSTRAAWDRARPGRGRLAELARLALAAGVGALLASAAWTRYGPTRTEVVERVVTTPVEVASVPIIGLPDEPNLFDTEVFPEVSWPTETEGDLP